MGFPRTVANVACRALVDFLVPIAGGVIFVFCRFGEGELFSSDVDDESSSFSVVCLFDLRLEAHPSRCLQFSSWFSS